MATLRKRGNHYFIDRYFNGKRIREMTPATNKRAAEKYMLRILSREISGKFGIDVDMKYLEFKEKYLDYCSKEHRKSTYKRYLDIFNNFGKFIGNKCDTLFVSQIDRELINSYKYYRIGCFNIKNNQPISNYTINLELRGLRAFLNEARKRKILTSDSFGEVHFLELPEKPVRKLSIEQYQRILFEARHRYPNYEQDSFVPALITYIYTGCRKSELINLKWEQVDFDNKVIKIYSHDDFKTKTGKMTIIALHPKVIEALQKLNKNTEYVFPSPTGKRYTHRLYRKFKDIVKYLGFGDVRLHDLRHSLGSHLEGKRVSLSTVANILGHKDKSTTMIYQNSAPMDAEVAINSLPDWEKVV